MKTDRELLELAAKAAGIDYDIYGDSALMVPRGHPVQYDWNPLTDDGDALRLAVKLNIHVLRYETMTTARPLLQNFACDERDDGDPNAATRRAILRAAAEIGKAMP